MVLLNDVKQMQQQGLSDEEIIRTLKEKGNNPLDIQQALDQSKIKSAIDAPDNSQLADIAAPSPGDAPQVYEDMTPSIMAQPQPMQAYPAYQEAQDYSYSQLPEYQEYSPEQQQGYQMAPDVINDIIEQVIAEKIDPLRKSMLDLNDFKLNADRKIKSMEERMKKMEETYDALQMALLGRIGSYLKNTEDIRKEMSMMSESFSKISEAASAALKKKSITRIHKKRSQPHAHPHHGVG